MGLDMYLYARKPLFGGKYSEKDERDIVQELRTRFGIPPSGNLETVELKFEIAYWRKANQIHSWFVKNVQNGRDECQDSYVTREQLVQLRDLCKETLEKIQLVDGQVCTGELATANGWEKQYEPGMVVANPEVAEQLLPASGGFFFGSTEYDQWYVQDLKDTIEQLDRILNCHALDDMDFEYCASW